MHVNMHDLNIVGNFFLQEMDINFLRDLDLSKYIPADKLAAMSDLEQKCCANRIRNYEMLKSVGMLLS